MIGGNSLFYPSVYAILIVTTLFVDPSVGGPLSIVIHLAVLVTAAVVAARLCLDMRAGRRPGLAAWCNSAPLTRWAVGVAVAGVILGRFASPFRLLRPSYTWSPEPFRPMIFGSEPLVTYVLFMRFYPGVAAAGMALWLAWTPKERAATLA